MLLPWAHFAAVVLAVWALAQLAVALTLKYRNKPIPKEKAK